MIGKTGILALALGLLLSGGVCAAESQSLTLSLDSPSLGGATQPQAATDSRSSQTRPPAAAPEPKDDTVTVGRVGMVCVSIAYIYASQSPSSRKFATVKQETPLAITKEEGAWYGVLMSNGATGWIPRKNVRMIGYNLVANKTEMNRGAFASRGGQPMRTTLLTASQGNDLIKSAMQFTGVRYVYGGTDPASGMDCSAFVRMVFREHGVSLPRTAREQALVGEQVSFDDLQPGDRLYFSCKNSYVDHCGIYAGGGYFVHCSSGRGGVGVDTLASDFWWRTLVTARRS